MNKHKQAVQQRFLVAVTPGDLDTAPQTRRYVYTISGEGAASFSVSPTPEGAAQIRTTA